MDVQVSFEKYPGIKPLEDLNIVVEKNPEIRKQQCFNFRDGKLELASSSGTEKEKFCSRCGLWGKCSDTYYSDTSIEIGDRRSLNLIEIVDGVNIYEVRKYFGRNNGNGCDYSETYYFSAKNLEEIQTEMAMALGSSIDTEKAAIRAAAPTTLVVEITNQKYPGIQPLETLRVGEGYMYYPDSYGSNMSPISEKDLGNRIDLDENQSISVEADLSSEDGPCFVYERRICYNDEGHVSCAFFYSPLTLAEINDLCIAKFAEAWQEERNTIRKLNKKISCLKAEIRKSSR